MASSAAAAGGHVRRSPARSPVACAAAVCSPAATAAAVEHSTNPLLGDWAASEPFGLPPFSKITPEHFRPAFDAALAANLTEVQEIASNTAEPSFENTALALDRAGSQLDLISKLFSNLCSSATSPELQQVELEMAPILASHESKVYTMPGLFQRIDQLHSTRHTASLNPEQVRLVERLHLDFVRAGARFDAKSQQRYAAIMERLAAIQTQFTQNVMGDESSFTLVLSQEDLSGCPADLVAAARQAATERNCPEDQYVITLSRSLVEPFLTFSDRRDLREKAWQAWTRRGELDAARDNHALMKEILLLRAEQAALHGYQSFAEYQTADSMAGSPSRVMELLENVWSKAKFAADRERQALEAYVAEAKGEQVDIQPWDWRYYAEKVRQSRYSFDEALLKPYLSLDAMTAAVFDVAHKLFGLRFVKRPDVAGYHEDVQVYEVREWVAGAAGQPQEDRLLAVFLHDNFGRQNKRSGAWMSELRTACPDLGSVPIICNNNNFARGGPSASAAASGESATAGEPTLLSFDDARTLFHEFGHGCHGMLSRTAYLRLAGTSVLRDFVELPSQLMEHWLEQPEVLKKHALHYRTGEPIPDELLAKLKAARAFNQGFGTIEYVASALIDQALHALPAAELEKLDLKEFEERELNRLGMPQGICMRHRPAHFQHLFSTSFYAASYYVYLWAEVLDADGFEAFLEAGSCFDKETAEKARTFIYSSGNSIEPGAAFRAFRGRDPIIEPMLKKKGMIPALAAA